MQYPLLVHQSLVWTIVNHTLAKYGSCQPAIDFLGVEIGVLSIQDEVVAFLTEEDCRRFSKKNEGETITVLGPTVKEELIGVYAILDRAANPWEYVEDYRRAVRIGKAKLADHILGNSSEDDKNNSRRDSHRKRQISGGLLHRQHGANRWSMVDGRDN